MFRNIKRGIKNIIKWTPVVWKDRDYDYEFLLEMMKFKLENMEDFFRDKGIAVDAELRANDIGLCVELLENIIKDRYFEDVFEPFYEKWGKSNFILGDEDDNGYVKMDIVYPNVKTEEDEKEMQEDLKNASFLESKMKEDDLNKLFEILNDKILDWWD